MRPMVGEVHRWGFVVDNVGMGVNGVVAGADGMGIDTNGMSIGPWMQVWVLTK